MASEEDDGAAPGKAKQEQDEEDPLDTEWRVVELSAEVTERLLIDPIRGPVTYQVDGSTGFHLNLNATPQLGDRDGGHQKRGGRNDFSKKLWYMMSNTEQEIILLTVAKKNSKLRDWKGALVADIEKEIEYVGTWLYGSQDWERYVVSKVAGGKLRVEGRLESGVRTSGLLVDGGASDYPAGCVEAELELPKEQGRYRPAGSLRLRFIAPGRLVFDFKDVSADSWRTDIPLRRERRKVVIQKQESIKAAPAGVLVGG